MADVGDADEDRLTTAAGSQAGFVKQLRAKLGEDAAHPALLFNERGGGYRMSTPDEA